MRVFGGGDFRLRNKAIIGLRRAAQQPLLKLMRSRSLPLCWVFSTLHRACLFLLARGRMIVQVAVVDDVEVLQGMHDKWACQALRAQTSSKPAICHSTSAGLAKKCRHLPRGSAGHCRQHERIHAKDKTSSASQSNHLASLANG